MWNYGVTKYNSQEKDDLGIAETTNVNDEEINRY